jgi:16S rRNA processing protein RimM
LTSSKKTTPPSRVPSRNRDQAVEGSRSTPSQESWVHLAHIRRTQGRKGEVFADILTDFPERFADRRKLWLLAAKAMGAPRLDSETWESTNLSSPTREVDLIHHWLHKGGIVLHFAGIDSISAAEGLIGFFVAIPLADRAPLASDEAYISDLVGCTVVNVAGSAPVVVGVIEDVDRSSGPVPLLVLRGAQGEVLIPFAKSYLHRIDLAAKRIEMALPEGLVDLNVR